MSVAALVSACSSAEDGTTGPNDDTAALTERLPEPAIWRVDPPVLNSEERRRHREIEHYLAQRYRGQRIVETTQTYVGDIIDWFDPATVPGSDAEPPPRPSPAELQPPPGTQVQLTELDVHPELRGPVGTIPVVRPSFEIYLRGETKALSVEDFVRNYQVPGRPGGPNRLYAGMATYAANQRAVSDVNEFSGAIEADTFSLLEMAVIRRGSNPSTTHEQVGVAISRDMANFKNSTVRLQVEFLSAGLDVTGDLIGGWDGKAAGFVAAVGRPYGPGVALLASTIGGTQYASHLEIQLFGSGWWISHNGNWLGYYPSERFDLINFGADEVDWYGEVFDRTPTDWTWTNMGSGLFATAGNGKAAYFRRPFYYDTSGISHWPDQAFNVGPNDLACYTRTNLSVGGVGSERYFYVGGPGGDATGCN